MKPARFRHYAPATVAEVVARLARLAPEDGLAGRQSLVPNMAFRRARPHLIGAEMVAKSTRRTRCIAARDSFAGMMTTALAEDEVLSEARLPLLPPGTRVGFEFSRRAGDFASAMALVFSVGGTIVGPRLAVGAAGPHRRRVERAAGAGEVPGPAAFAAAAERAAAAVQPTEDAQNTARYRRDLVRTATRRVLEQAA